MTVQQVFAVEAEGYQYRNLICENDRQFRLKFIHGTVITDLPSPLFRMQTLEEDIQAEEEQIAMGDTGDPDEARKRYENGVGDCAYAYGFSTSLIFSKKATDQIGKILEATGQLFRVDVNGDEFFIYNCTRLIDAINPNESLLTFNSRGRPTGFEKLCFQASSIENELIFKTRWPKPTNKEMSFDYSSIPPPSPIYVTEPFVELVNNYELTGFQFNPVGTVNSG